MDYRSLHASLVRHSLQCNTDVVAHACKCEFGLPSGNIQFLQIHLLKPTDGWLPFASHNKGTEAADAMVKLSVKVEKTMENIGEQRRI